MEEKLVSFVITIFSVLYLAFWLACLERLIADTRDGLKFQVEAWKMHEAYALFRATEPVENSLNCLDCDFSCVGWIYEEPIQHL